MHDASVVDEHIEFRMIRNRLCATAAMLAGSATSSSTDCIPGLALTVSARWPFRRPEMITSLPSLWNASARPRPIPDPPPVMKMIFPGEVHRFVSFAWFQGMAASTVDRK